MRVSKRFWFEFQFSNRPYHPMGQDPQFERSGPATPEEKVERIAVDPIQALQKFKNRDADAGKMTGKEMYAIIDHLKTSQQHADSAHALENDMMKIKRQFDKKFMLVQWIADNLIEKSDCEQPHVSEPLADLSNHPVEERPKTAPPPAGATPAKKHRDSCGLPRLTQSSNALGLTDFEANRLLDEYASGRDHLTMTGKELYPLISHLSSHGHDDIEDALMKIRHPADKKLHLTHYIKRVHQARTIVEEPEQPTNDGVQKLTDEDTAHEESQPCQSNNTMKYAPPAAGKLQTQIATLEATLLRMEESHAFAVECMHADMAQARAQLSALRSTMQNIVDVMQS